MKLALLPNLTRENALEISLEVCRELDNLNTPYIFSLDDEEIFKATRAEFLPFEKMLECCDALITIGGDGTIIHAAKKAAEFGKPVLGINAGRLAFMAGLERSELKLLNCLVSGSYTVDKRMLLRAQIMRGEELLASNCCVNDTVISKSGKMKIVELSVDCNGKHINNYTGDGIIIATPTGSTAYSLSAGGPVVDPLLDSILLTPVCTHSLFIRSLILKADSTFTVRAVPGSEFSVSCDGEEPVAVPDDCSVVVGKAEISAEFIRIKPDTFIDVLNRKLAQWQDLG